MFSWGKYDIAGKGGGQTGRASARPVFRVRFFLGGGVSGRFGDTRQLLDHILEVQAADSFENRG